MTHAYTCIAVKLDSKLTDGTCLVVQMYPHIHTDPYIQTYNNYMQSGLCTTEIFSLMDTTKLKRKIKQK